ncbi:MAG: HAD family phosphatase [Bacteroidales bacterium]|nr:HAD family phosphatase [Bacteroidales bacterium]
MIKNLIFDLGGVLLDIDLQYNVEQMKALGIDMDAFNKNSTTAPEGEKPAVLGEGLVANGMIHLYQTGNITTEQFMESVREISRPGTTCEEVKEAWNTCILNIPKYRLEKLAELKKRGYRIYILSNTNEAHWVKIVNECFGGQDAVDTLFDHTFLSQEMHLAKPNDAIFLKVLEDIGAEAEDCLFVDDSSANTTAASALGFHTMHVETSRAHNGKVIASPQVDWVNQIDSKIKYISFLQ